MQHSSYKEFLKSYMDVLPREDLTSLIFWPKNVLTEIDSDMLVQQYLETSSYYQHLHKLLTQNPDSPYAKNNAQLPIEEFLWAFSVVSSRQLSLNNGEGSQEDPNLQLLIMPLLDFVNHSPTTQTEGPNVVALPYHDTVNNESFVLL